jgi:hypothetical protein
MRFLAGLAAPLALASGLAACGGRTAQASGPMPADFLTATSFDALTIEVVPVSSLSPDPAALQLMATRAQEHCHKPSGIQVVVDESTGPEVQGPWSFEGLTSVARAHRTHVASGREVVLEVMYVDGALGSDERAIGTTIDHDLIVIFKQSLADLGGTPDQMTRLEASTLVHELGHALGLVNRDVLMVTPHEDTQHSGHCMNPLCVMFWELERSPPAGLQGMAADFPPLDYDDACKRDLTGAGGM